MFNIQNGNTYVKYEPVNVSPLLSIVKFNLPKNEDEMEFEILFFQSTKCSHIPLQAPEVNGHLFEPSLFPSQSPLVFFVVVWFKIC